MGDDAENLCILLLGMLVITFSSIALHEQMHVWQHPDKQVNQIIYFGMENGVDTMGWMRFTTYLEDDWNEEATPTFVTVGYMLVMMFWLVVGLIFGDE